MSSELSILALYGLLVALTVFVQVLAAVPQAGLAPLAGPRDDLPPLTGLAGRCKRSLDNSVVAMALFAPAILILAARDAFTATTLQAAQIFLTAQVVYLPLYWLGIAWVRTLVWLIGFLATIYLLFAAF
ncbi:MAPEG family protein [Jhaorihella thermophila]|uniref:Uncharacterized conserved protein, MAPEG superfamily n=1 Tax=Jhaorihella thermophila TaxID=488547 RepID=A0A1H5RT96_9RHOB|nr:MAPEG family protein [Jhaorihella thermophila]SEF40807.1 Uncharacterized conserved protein, MAPEG superfamily [Jhaorihella thermophila]